LDEDSPADVDSGVGYRYPHNFVLEMGFSYGMSGLLLAVLMLFLALRGAIRSLLRDPPIAALVCYVVLNAQISGDIVSNRLMFFVAGYGLLFRLRHDSASRGRFVLQG
jgi:O-antigen ligase